MSQNKPKKTFEGLRELQLRSGKKFYLPLFLPVYQPQSAIVPMESWKTHFEVEGCIVNAFFLYKNRQTRELFATGEELHNYIGSDGLIMTDSGAFQGFTRQLFLENKKIVAFQHQIGADIVSPLDLVTPPKDNHAVAERKLKVTNKRIREAKEIVSQSILAGVQQGGRFLDLRHRSVEELMEIGVEYVAIGSLVPFFNRNRNLAFVGNVLRDARAVIGAEIPMHIYGAGDPVELPFLAELGADIFDSSSYGHYAGGGWYMTSYGAVKEASFLLKEAYLCPCHICTEAENLDDVFKSESALAAHNLWTILDTVQKIRAAKAENRLESMLKEILERHVKWFPQSALEPSWNSLYE